MLSGEWCCEMVWRVRRRFVENERRGDIVREGGKVRTLGRHCQTRAKSFIWRRRRRSMKGFLRRPRKANINNMVAYLLKGRMLLGLQKLAS